MSDNSESNNKSRQGFSLSRKAAVIFAVIIAAAVGVSLFFAIRGSRTASEAEQREQQLLIEMAQADLERDYNELSDEFQAFENQRQFVVDDSVRRELNDKYEAARLQIERLQQQLADTQNRSAAEIQQLRNEINTLRNLLRHYVEEIDRLNQENQALRQENTDMRRRNEQLNARVTETERRNEQLSERMTLAERLNVTGVDLTPLNRKGRTESKVSKAKQLMVTFHIAPNNSTPVGEKTFYLRITSPSGQLLGNGGAFEFEGGSVPCTARKTIEYTGEEYPEIKMYYDVDTPLIAGDYTVELFADNYRLVSRNFTLR